MRTAIATGLVGLLLACQGAPSEGESTSSTAADTDRSSVAEWTAKLHDFVTGSDEPAEPEPDPADLAPVRCEIKGSVAFMSRDDCLARRGKPL